MFHNERSPFRIILTGTGSNALLVFFSEVSENNGQICKGEANGIQVLYRAIFFVKKSGSTNNTLNGPSGINLPVMDCTINI